MSFLPPKPDPIFFTKEGLATIQAEFDRLTTLRPQILVRLQAAREMGDLSENGAYHAAKFELGSTDRQLRDLTFKLRYGQIYESKATDRVDFGHTVTLMVNGQVVKYRFVSKYESDPQKHKLSVDSPIGQALMGKKVGESAKVVTPNGEISYQVVKITSA
jgi:transcription elongation factor GreA